MFCGQIFRFTEVVLVKSHDIWLPAQAVKQLPSSNMEAKPYTPIPSMNTPMAIARVTADRGWLNSANKAMNQPMYRWWMCCVL